MKVAIISFECVPFAKVGGLADVVGTLPLYIKKHNLNVQIVIPLHKKIDKEKFNLKDTGEKIIVPVGSNYETGSVYQSSIGTGKYKVPVYFIESDKYFNRDEIYRTKEGDYPDNPERFIFFSKATLEALKAVDFKPDILHCNDMQSGLIPAYLKTLYRIDAFYSRTKTVFTIHNIAYQGFYSKDVFYLAGFSDVDFTPEKLEYYGGINFMKAGIVYSDVVTTVSKTYAIEIQTLAEFGRGLEGVLASRSNELFGIVNGIDYEEWNPETDKTIVKNFSADNLTGKEYCKKDLQKMCNLPQENVAIFGMVSRLDSLKGFDLLSEIFPEVMKLPLQLVILGLGDKIYEDKLTEFSKKYPKKLSINLRFDNNLAHKIYAGSDFFLMPSAAEPCGLSQMIAMRYGTIPVVHKTGGLADTVKQVDIKSAMKGKRLKGTGIVFEKYCPDEFLNAIQDALKLYKNTNLFNTIRKNAFSQDFSWERSVKEYIKIYKSLESRV